MDTGYYSIKTFVLWEKHMHQHGIHKLWILIILFLPLLVYSCSENDQANQQNKKIIKKQTEYKAIPITNSKNRLTRKEVDQYHYDWLKRTVPEWYRHEMNISGGFNKEVYGFLSQICKYKTGQPDSLDIKELLYSARIIMKNDLQPLFLIYYGQMLFENEEYEKAKPIVETAIKDLEHAAHLNIHSYFAEQLMNKIHARKKTGKYSKQNYWEELAAASIVRAVTTGEFLENDLRIAFDFIDKNFINDNKQLIIDKLKKEKIFPIGFLKWWRGQTT